MELIRNTAVSSLGFTHVPFCPHNMVAMLGSLVSPFSAYQLTHIARLNWSVGSSLFKFSRILAVFPVEASFPLTWDTGPWILQNLRLLDKNIHSAIPLFDFQIHISHNSGDWKSRIMVPAWSGSDGSLSLSCRLWLLFVVSHGRTGMLFTSSQGHESHSIMWTVSMISSTPNYLPKPLTFHILSQWRLGFLYL